MIEDRPEVLARLQEATVGWLTTVDPAGQPQPSVVWYVMDGGDIVVYSKAGTPRLRNLQADHRVAFNLNSDHDGDDVVIVEGEAEIVGREVPPSQDRAYVEKYERHLGRWGFTWESYDKGYPVRIVIRPTRLRHS